MHKNVLTGELRYQQVLAQYNNPYDYTVYVEVIDDNGNKQTIVSNKIHPFFAQFPEGTQPIMSSEGHHYRGEIAQSQWIDAQNLRPGYKLLSSDGSWQQVNNVAIKAEKLTAYNLTVADFHTYFVKGKAGENGVWVHNDCLPVSKPILSKKNGEKYISNPKHTLGQKGNRPNAGIEPRNSFDLFESSIQSGYKRYSLDKNGNINQFSYSNDGTWHWSGRTGKDQALEQRLNGNNIPNDVIKYFELKPKDVKKW